MTFTIDGKSAMFSYRRYAQLLIIFIVLPVVLLAVTGALFFQPYWGPLTRLGGFLENDYGWNAPQEAFSEPLFHIANTINEYNRYYDVVVVGDSFSFDQKKGWQNYLVKKTGLSVITLSHSTGLEQVVKSEMFRSNPPRYLVFESLEQFSMPRLAKLTSLPSLERVGEPAYRASGNVMPVATVRPRLTSREETPPLGSTNQPPPEARIGQFLDYLQKALVRRLSTEPTADELRSLWGSALEHDIFALSIRDGAGSLFSSRQKDRMLVYSLDVGKVTDESVIKQAAEGAWQMKKSIEANGRTKVLLMIFPDKLTIYTPYLVDPSVAPPSIIPPLAREFPHQLRLDQVFAKAVAERVQDLYLPSDTHCGYKGYQMAAEQLALAIEEDQKQLSRMVE